MDREGLEPSTCRVRTGRSCASMRSRHSHIHVQQMLWPIELTIRGAPGRNRTGTTFGHRVLSAARLPISPQAQVVVGGGSTKQESYRRLFKWCARSESNRHVTRTLRFEGSAYAIPPGREHSESWHTGRDSNPQRAALETAALPVALPVQSESQMFPASGSRRDIAQGASNASAFPAGTSVCRRSPGSKTR